MSHYSTPERILLETGIKTADLGLKDIPNGLTADEQLTNQIIIWLEETKSLIDNDRNTDLITEFGSLEDIPPCITSIATRICVNMVNRAKLNRESPVIKTSDYSVKTVDSEVFTQVLKDELENCFKRSFEKSSGFNIFRIPGAYEDEEEESDVWF